MLKLPKPAAIAIQATLGIALSVPWAVPALAAPANTATQTQTTPLLHEGDLIRLRSGGPAMTVKSVQGNWVVATWWNEGFGGFQSSGFPLAMVDGPITLPPVDVSPQTPPQTSSPPTSPTEPSERPPGDLSSAGQPNQNPTAQGTNQTRQVRPVNASTSTSPSTRPARILPSQQSTGPLHQGTGTNQTIGVAHLTIGVAHLRPTLALPLQQGTAFNQTVNIPLQQGTGTNQTIGVPQVRPMLVLPQGTVQQALPLPL